MTKKIGLLMALVFSSGFMSGCTYNTYVQHEQPTPSVEIAPTPVLQPTVAVEPAPQPQPQAAAPAVGGETFLNTVYVLVKGAPAPAPLTFVCVRVQSAPQGNRAYVGEIPPTVALPPGTHLVRVQINNNGVWVPVWAVTQN